ncbi:MAG: hypothetical protein EKK33_01375 [Bradyrhizobiaceae bacterium]|nr:MAG: hypothetical protein EKK33_01375 [Bradyrhizobiaceae bacterium]
MAMKTDGQRERDDAVKMHVLAYWRSFPAERFDDLKREEVAKCIEAIARAFPIWGAVIRGGAAAASGIVLRLRAPPEICLRVDLAMTVLLNTAFENAGAALVLSYGLRSAPLDPNERSKLATSWLVYNLRRENRRLGGRSSDFSQAGARQEDTG